MLNVLLSRRLDVCERIAPQGAGSTGPAPSFPFSHFNTSSFCGIIYEESYWLDKMGNPK